MNMHKFTCMYIVMMLLELVVAVSFIKLVSVGSTPQDLYAHCSILYNGCITSSSCDLSDVLHISLGLISASLNQLRSIGFPIGDS